jgi:uncharacterized protein YndB with AHSA1/START domain
VQPRHCSIRLTRRLAATPEEVWKALTDPESLARWLGRPNDVDLTPGGAFVLQLSEGDRIEGRVREVERQRVLELDWRREGEEVSRVRFELVGEETGTVLVLDHSLVDERHGMAYMARWTALLERLETAVQA